MAPTRRRYLLAAAGAVTLAGCRSDSNGSGTPTTETGEPGDPSTAGGRATGPTVAVREHDELGDVLVDADGRTLYMFDSDTRGSSESTCSGACLDAWPPLPTDGDVTAGDGVDAGLGTFERSDGTTQVTANGWPLYYYTSDSSPGDATGQGVNEVWWVLDTGGAPVQSSGGPTAATDAGASGPSY